MQELFMHLHNNITGSDENKSFSLLFFSLSFHPFANKIYNIFPYVTDLSDV